jgi:hypothetical protein
MPDETSAANACTCSGSEAGATHAEWCACAAPDADADETDAVEPWRCAECGAEETEEAPERENRNGEPLCRSCLRCADCEEDLSGERWEVGRNCDGARVCESCAESYVYSGPMDCVIRSEDAVYIDDAEEYVTQDYAERHYFYHESAGEWRSYEEETEDEDSLLFEYGEDVLDHVSYDRAAIRRGALLLGVELEMEPREGHSQADVVEALGGRAHETHILKYDGSIPTGAELVTAPLTLAEHRGERIDWRRTLAPVQTVAMSGAGTTHCGMHVHANKAAVTPLTIGKLLVFLNSDRTDELVTLVAQRRSNGYCEKKEKKVSDGRFGSESRYERLNITPNTLEFRVFRGNLRAERVLKNLEFVVASIAFCAESSIREVDNPARFLAWLVERERDYPALAAFLRERNALQPSKAKKGEKKCA